MLDEDAALLGIDSAVFAPVKEEDRDLEIWPENWEAVEVFVAMATQWRHSSLGGVVGLDYVALNTVMGILAVRDVKDVFYCVRIMESEALTVINRQVEKANGRKKV
jgi:hypothetical protein